MYFHAVRTPLKEDGFAGLPTELSARTLTELIQYAILEYSSNMFAVRAIVSGRVQLVMFRDFVERKASGLGLVGVVQNLSDGTVEVLAQGGKEKLEALIALLHKGPVLARVDAVAVEWVEPKGDFKGFSIQY